MPLAPTSSHIRESRHGPIASGSDPRHPGCGATAGPRAAPRGRRRSRGRSLHAEQHRDLRRPRRLVPRPRRRHRDPRALRAVVDPPRPRRPRRPARSTGRRRRTSSSAGTEVARRPASSTPASADRRTSSAGASPERAPPHDVRARPARRRPADRPPTSTRLLGRGPGLTPLGDDVLAGWLATRPRLGRPDTVLAAAVRRRLGVTTLLSATLLDCALRGEALPQLADWLADPTPRPPRRCWPSAPPRAPACSTGAELALPRSPPTAHRPPREGRMTHPGRVTGTTSSSAAARTPTR